MGVIFQVIATVLLCFSCFNMGLINSWPSSTILLFKSENTTLHRPMGNVEIALFGSLPAIGALIGQPLTCIVLDVMGRKRTTVLTALIFVISWSIIAITNRVETVLIAVFISGIGYAIFYAVIIYISEISQDSIRGTLTAGPNQFSGIGILASYFLGGALDYHVMVYTCLSLAVIGVVMIAVLKESPVSLMARGREEEAARSIAFYHRVCPTSSEVVAEINNIRRTLYSTSDDAQSLTTVNEKLTIHPECEPMKISWWQHFKTTPTTRREFYLVLILKTAYVCQGLPVVQVYAEPMFAEAVGDVISPNLCSVVLGVVVIVAGVVAAYLVDVVGRRPLLIGSSISASICCIVLGTQILTEWLPKWTIPLLIYVYATSHTCGAGTVPFVVGGEVFLPMPLQIYSSIVTNICCVLLGTQINICVPSRMETLPKWTVPLFMYIFATSHTIGSGTVPFVMAAEVFLPQVKSILLVLTVEWSYTCQFCVLFFFNILVQSIGLAPVFYFFSFVCFATAVYFFYFLPETKGLPVYAIQELFKQNQDG